MKTLPTRKGPRGGRPAYLSKTQVALRYWPDRSPRTARRYLVTTILESARLHRGLKRLGWSPRTRLYTPQMMRMISESFTSFLG